MPLFGKKEQVQRSWCYNPLGLVGDMLKDMDVGRVPGTTKARLSFKRASSYIEKMWGFILSMIMGSY